MNDRAWELATALREQAEDLRIAPVSLPGGGQILDFGVQARGGLKAGLRLAELCLSGLGEVRLESRQLGGRTWPAIATTTDAPLPACLLSQYAGWQIARGSFFGMGSGPMRAAAATEELFGQLNYQESPANCVGVLEAAALPDESVFEFLTEKTGVPAASTVLAVARTASLAGTVQVVARSVETALHQLHELEFDLSRIVSGYGTAPLPPVAHNDLTAIGRTNDAILYGGTVVLWVTGDDTSLKETGSRVPSSASPASGKPFLEIFEAAGRDFYAIDPALFSPAEVIFQNIETGHTFRFGELREDLLAVSFGLSPA
ncbi:MAG: methenyltetrahydromethanopterin cyclohydrolase [Planctomycetaceae bacterium]|nr:methenyltetrahydromethanopterin cyclohydrolase [Planctomycetaceae bacterium]